MQYFPTWLIAPVDNENTVVQYHHIVGTVTPVVSFSTVWRKKMPVLEYVEGRGRVRIVRNKTDMFG